MAEAEEVHSFKSWRGKNVREGRVLCLFLLKWGIFGVWAGLVSGISSALFLELLAWATASRVAHPALLFLLPVAGLAIGYAYDRFGKSVASGNNLLLERIHDRRTTEAIPFRMAPLVFLGTVITHLFGGSAGREGTAVQMGGTLASAVTGPLGLSSRDHRMLIAAGISGGFGAVFGTPLAGTLFGLEVLSVGRMSYESLVPCLVAACVGDVVCRGLGVQHVEYRHFIEVYHLTPWRWFLIVAASALFALAAAGFTELIEAVSHAAKRTLPNPLLRPVVGGVAVIALTFALGTHAYLGLSLPLIAQSFSATGVVPWAFALKIVFTAVTLGTGFKGGEVTPLFCVGATLGSAFALLTGQPPALFAALGFVAVFAGAANTPITCVLMGIELFGGEMALPILVACVVAYILSGHRGIYGAQQVGTPKAHGISVRSGATLGNLWSGGHLRYSAARRQKTAADPPAEPSA